jgi:hypothetical protein
MRGPGEGVIRAKFFVDGSRKRLALNISLRIVGRDRSRIPSHRAGAGEGQKRLGLLAERLA